MKFVSFGPWGDWYIKWSDGKSEWLISNIRENLDNILKNRIIHNLYIGPNNKYFVAYDEYISYYDLPAGVMKRVCNAKKTVSQVLVDEESDTYFVRYSFKK